MEGIDPERGWMVTLACSHVTVLPHGPCPTLTHCAQCGQASRVMLAIRQ